MGSYQLSWKAAGLRGRIKKEYHFLTQNLLLFYPILSAFRAAGLGSDVPDENLTSVGAYKHIEWLTASKCFTAVNFSGCSVDLINGVSISACFASNIFFLIEAVSF